jgi:YHS domain-containing protein
MQILDSTKYITGRIAMLKRISCIGLIIMIGVVSATFYHVDIAKAGTYKLEYPQGYGNCCPPNVKEFGYFRTGWREWPGEVRLDKTFPKAVSMERIPTPAGEKTLPLPRIKVKPPVTDETTPSLEGGGMTPLEAVPGEATPGALPTEPGQATPTLPGLPTEPGGFNPLPGLPSDIGGLKPPDTNVKEESAPPVESKEEPAANPDVLPKDDNQTKPDEEKAKTDASTTKLENRGPQIKSPLSSSKTNQYDLVGHSQDIVRGVVYNDYVKSPASEKLPRDVAPQSSTPSVAMDGFCPVALSLNGRWVPGDPRWNVNYKGHNYRFSGNAQRQEFLANPEKFVPASGGFDPVIAATERRNVPGQVTYCAAYKGRVYMFANAATQGYFQKNPELYAGGEKK